MNNNAKVQLIKMSDGTQYGSPKVLNDIEDRSHYLRITPAGSPDTTVIYLNKMAITEVHKYVDRDASEWTL